MGGVFNYYDSDEFNFIPFIEDSTYLSWHKIEISYNSLDVSMWFDEKQWCEKNTEFNVVFGSTVDYDGQRIDGYVYFEDTQDAVAFKLRWL